MKTSKDFQSVCTRGHVYVGTGEKQPFVPSIGNTMKVAKFQPIWLLPGPIVKYIYINFIHHVRAIHPNPMCTYTCTQRLGANSKDPHNLVRRSMNRSKRGAEFR